MNEEKYIIIAENIKHESADGTTQTYNLVYDSDTGKVYLINIDNVEDIIDVQVDLSGLPTDIDLASWEGIIEVVAIARAQLDKELGPTNQELSTITYNRTTWQNDITPLDEINLNNIESGIYLAHARLNDFENVFNPRSGSLRNDLNGNGYNISNINRYSGAALNVEEIIVGDDSSKISLKDGVVDFGDKVTLKITGKEQSFIDTLCVKNLIAQNLSTNAEASNNFEEIFVNNINTNGNTDINVTSNLNLTGNLTCDGNLTSTGNLSCENINATKVNTETVVTNRCEFKNGKSITINYGGTLPTNAVEGDIFFVIK